MLLVYPARFLSKKYLLFSLIASLSFFYLSATSSIFYCYLMALLILREVAYWNCTMLPPMINLPSSVCLMSSAYIFSGFFSVLTIWIFPIYFNFSIVFRSFSFRFCIRLYSNISGPSSSLNLRSIGSYRSFWFKSYCGALLFCFYIAGVGLMDSFFGNGFDAILVGIWMSLYLTCLVA